MERTNLPQPVIPNTVRVGRVMWVCHRHSYSPRNKLPSFDPIHCCSIAGKLISATAGCKLVPATAALQPTAAPLLLQTAADHATLSQSSENANMMINELFFPQEIHDWIEPSSIRSDPRY